MGEACVWRDVLVDIMECIPLRALQHALPGMSPDELLRKAVLLTRLDIQWSKDVAKPARVKSHALCADVCRTEILLGGDYMLTLFKDGVLQLLHTEHLSTILAEVSRPCHPEHRVYHPDTTDMRRSCSSHGQNWTVLVDCYTTNK